jgi:hypothetical protein
VRSRLDVVSGAQPLGERVQSAGTARGEEQVTPFLREGLGDRRADALRSARDESALAT